MTFADHAISGASTARPAFEALMERVKRREVDVLLVDDTSRLSRDNADALNLYKQLSFYGVQLVAISDGIDSSTKGAKLAYSVQALMSDLYLEDLRDKTLRGMEGRALAGSATGGRLLGYRTTPIMGPDGRTPASFQVEIDPEGAALVRNSTGNYTFTLVTGLQQTPLVLTASFTAGFITVNAGLSSFTVTTANTSNVATDFNSPVHIVMLGR